MLLADFISGTSLILLGVLIVTLGALMFALYTRKGSGIETRSWDGTQRAPGAKGREEVSGRDEGEGSSLNTRGTE